MNKATLQLYSRLMAKAIGSMFVSSIKRDISVHCLYFIESYETKAVQLKLHFYSEMYTLLINLPLIRSI